MPKRTDVLVTCLGSEADKAGRDRCNGSSARSQLPSNSRRMRSTHKHATHDPIAPRQRVQSLLLRQGHHDVEEGQEAGCLHCSPCYLPGYVESRRCGSLAGRIPRLDPLEDGELHVPSACKHSREMGARTSGNNWKQKTSSSQCSLVGGSQPSSKAIVNK